MSDTIEFKTGTGGADVTYRPLHQVVTREIAGETLLVPIRGRVDDMHHIFAMNPVAAHIWQAIDGSTPAGAIVAGVGETFEVDMEQAGQDVAAFLEELAQAGLIARVD
jgi:hypothetical protein